MQKIASTLFALTLLLPAAPAFAEANPPTASSTSSVKERVMERVEAFKGKIENRRQEIANKVETFRASTTARRVTVEENVAKRLVAHAAQVLTATAERLSKIGDRIQSRIEKVKAAGGDTTVSEQALADARADIADAKAKLASFSSVDLSADKISDTVEALRGVAQGVKSDLKAARSSLSDAINSLKPGLNGARGNATSTAASSATTTEQ